MAGSKHGYAIQKGKGVKSGFIRKNYNNKVSAELARLAELSNVSFKENREVSLMRKLFALERMIVQELKEIESREVIQAEKEKKDRQRIQKNATARKREAQKKVDAAKQVIAEAEAE